jgi:hypothetical protein
MKNRPGEAKEMKKALLCDTLSAPAMAHQLQNKRILTETCRQVNTDMNKVVM